MNEMLQNKIGYDIVQKIGGVSTIEAAYGIFEKQMDAVNLANIRKIKNEEALLKIANAIVMCRPDDIFVNTGSNEDVQKIRQMALDKGEEAKLAMEDHTIHFDLAAEQGRIIDRTFYIANPDEEISSLANRMDRDDALKVVQDTMSGIMEGKTMVIGFYNRGPVGSLGSNPAIEVTSSLYVSHSAELLYRNVFADFDAEVERLGHFYANIHSEGLNRTEDLPNARVFMDRSFQTTYSMNCTYAGNTLLLKKGNHRFSVDRAVYTNRGAELAEHMFITGIDGPGQERVTWFAGAAPSGCGKTTTAMAGGHFLGDDLAQMWIESDGTVRSVNPEAGIFGIVEDVNREGDPLLMDCLRKPGTEVIWSNVLIDDDKVPHWVGNGEAHPTKGFNFQGPWEEGMLDQNGKPVPMSHPNSRCTLKATALANCSDRFEDPAGVETSVITYSGRDSDTMPPVWLAVTPDHGVVIGASIVSAATATEVGATGVKRAPWANAPFIPGALADYMDAQFKFFNNEKIDDKKRPMLAGLNYFLTHEARGGESKKLLGEKRDVKVWLGWLERRFHGDVDAILTPIGYLPKYEDLKQLFKEIIDKEYSEDLYIKQFSLYIDNIVARVDLQKDAYGKEANVPARLFEILEEQRKGLMALKEKYGAIVTPAQLMA
jgi:phosphoenolpyruvate carboxykinase (GTP)